MAKFLEFFKICKLYYITQIDINALTFVAFINKKEKANFASKKGIENSIRNNLGFIGTPIVIRLKKKTEIVNNFFIY